MLGYEKEAESTGGWPGGYVSKCKSLKIYTGLEERTGNVTYGSAVIMLYNLLNVERTFAKDITGNIFLENKSVLEKYFDVNKGEGIVQSNSFTDLNGRQKKYTSSVIINGTEYDVAGDVPDLLGYNVKFYYRSSSGENEIIALNPYRNKTLMIESGNEIEYDEMFRKYSYVDNGRKYAELSPQYTLVYNNSAIVRSIKNYSIPSDGEIKLIDNNNDGKYDVVIVKDYKNRVVKKVAEANEELFFYTDKGTESISLKNLDYHIYGESGEERDFNDIKPSDGVYIMETPGNAEKEYYIYISSPSVNAKIERIESDCVITEDGRKLEFDRNADNLYRVNKIAVNCSGKFYINRSGRLFAYVTGGELQHELCFFIRIITDDEDGPLKAKMLKSDGTVEDFEINRKVSLRLPDINNIRSTIMCKTNEAVMTALSNYGGKIIRELVLIDTNADGKINQIEFPSSANYLSAGAKGNDYDLTGDGLHAYSRGYENYRTYEAGGNSWKKYTDYYHEYNMSEMLMTSPQTYYFSIPAVHVSGREEKDYKVISEFKSDTDYSMMLYGIESETTTVDAGVVCGDTGAEPTSDYYAVESVGTQTLVDDEILREMLVYNGTTAMKFYYDPSVTRRAVCLRI